MPSIVLSIICMVLFLTVAWLLSIPFYPVKSDSHPLPAEEEDVAARPPEDHLPPAQISPSAESTDRPWMGKSPRSGTLTERGARCASRTALVIRETASVSLVQKTAPTCPGLVVSPHARQIHSLDTIPHLIHAQSRYELEQEYERGMHTRYDETIGVIHFTGMQIVMNTPAEVEIAFHICKRQIRTALRLRGLERAPTLTDIRGIVIGREATAAWGQALKEYLDEMCIKADNDTYLLAHYNSQAPRPGQDQLQETIKRIQFMTSAAIYHFQSNIFDTREGAVAFLQRMRTVYRV